MRLRNIKDKNILYNSKYLIKDYEKNKGKFIELFPNSNPIHLEIGVGKGNFIINMALKYPEINFIGIEKYDSVLVRCAEKLMDLDIPNLKLLLVDAALVNEIFTNEIDTVYLNFSDPWPKSKHSKRRLSSPLFLSKYEKIFIDNAKIIQKTDNQGLFEFSLISYSDAGYKIEDVSVNYFDENNVRTEYEDKFISLGKPIYMVSVNKSVKE